MTSRRRRAKWLLLSLVAANVVLLLSSRAAEWWGDTRDRITYNLPEPFRGVAVEMAAWKEADVHVVMWMGVAFLAGLLALTWRRRVVAVAAVFGLAVLLELAQPLFNSRSFQLGDVVGDAIGVVVGGVLAAVATSVRARRSTTVRGGSG